MAKKMRGKTNDVCRLHVFFIRRAYYDDRELDPNHVKIKDGDRFMAKIQEVHHDGKILQQITFVKHPDDMSDMPLEQG